jgi:hypothetical protein
MRGRWKLSDESLSALIVDYGSKNLRIQPDFGLNWHIHVSTLPDEPHPHHQLAVARTSTMKRTAWAHVGKPCNII